MNVQDVINRVQRIFGDEAGVQITNDDLIRWINDSQEKIILSNEGLLETTGVADIVANQSQYDFPDDLSILRSISYNGYMLKQYSFNEFTEYLNGWNSPSAPDLPNAIPEIFMVWNKQVTLFPQPKVSLTSGLTIYYIRHPITVTTLADNLDLPIEYHNSVVDYCLQQAYELDEDLTKSNFKKSEFDETMMKLNDRNKYEQDTYPTITTLPEDDYYNINFGLGGYF